ncbi:MFS transporter [Halobacillus yeomjeoni]|uniref:MFS transporter n=1 Tax=Halobacillus yeomjeoni TaxID=311194 RepID=A0A931HWV1_9BACI|nr:MFS transporter [Halobacillus yeomjeoni]MBH0231307.1 MFS transporter [Halobacillus yeomjeoni]
MNQQGYQINESTFWKVALSLALASFFTFASIYAVQPLFPVFVQDFDISISMASLSLSLTVIGLIVGLIVLGFLSDRYGRTIFIKLSIIGASVPLLFIPIIDSFTVILAIRFIQGFAFAGLPAAAIAYVSEEIHPKHVHVATALYIASNVFGGMMGRVFAGAVTDWLSWESYFYILTGVGVVIAGLVIASLPHSRSFTPSDLTFKHDIKSLKFHVTNPTLLLIFGLGIIFQLSFTGIWTYLPFYLQNSPFFLSLSAISFFFFAYGLGVIGSPFAGWLAGHFGLSKVRLIGTFIFSIGIWMTLMPWLWAVALGLCVLCSGFFTAHSLTASSIGDLVTHHKGSAASLYLVSYYIGVVFGSSALSPIWNAYDWQGLVLILGFLPPGYMLLVRLVLKRTKKV